MKKLSKKLFIFMISILLIMSVSCIVDVENNENNEEISSGGEGAEVETIQINFIICLSGAFPPRTGTPVTEPMLGEIKMFAGNYAPSGWALCQGQILAISSNTALFTILGTQYGGDGRTTFALPDLRGKVVVHSSN